MVIDQRRKPSKPSDKRRRTDLEVFVLALIEAGISTCYEMQKSAQLSLGATNPVLQRLLSSGFVLVSQPGPRGRTRYRVSAAGKIYLAKEWRTLLEDGPTGDLEADLRIALLSIWFGGKRADAAAFLASSGTRRAAAVPASHTPASQKDAPLLARWYSDLRSISSRKIAQAELEVLHELAKALPRIKLRKPVTAPQD